MVLPLQDIIIIFDDESKFVIKLAPNIILYQPILSNECAICVSIEMLLLNSGNVSFVISIPLSDVDYPSEV